MYLKADKVDCKFLSYENTTINNVVFLKINLLLENNDVIHIFKKDNDKLVEFLNSLKSLDTISNLLAVSYKNGKLKFDLSIN